MNINSFNAPQPHCYSTSKLLSILHLEKLSHRVLSDLPNIAGFVKDGAQI